MIKIIEEPVEEVILVDERDTILGVVEKLKTHEEGLLHRAFSIFVYNSNGQLLLQQRASGKYHSANLWSNTCCGHPRPKESLEAAVQRRLKEEMGFDCKLIEAFSLLYNEKVGDRMRENEFCHVYVGIYDGEPKPSPAEVSSFRWVNLPEIVKDIHENPNEYAPWFKVIIRNHNFAWAYPFKPKTFL